MLEVLTTGKAATAAIILAANLTVAVELEAATDEVAAIDDVARDRAELALRVALLEAKAPALPTDKEAPDELPLVAEETALDVIEDEEAPLSVLLVLDALDEVAELLLEAEVAAELATLEATELLPAEDEEESAELEALEVAELALDEALLTAEELSLELEEVSALDELALLVFDESELLTALLADESAALVVEAVATELLATLDSAGIIALSPVARTS